MPISRRINKKVVVHIHHGILAIKKNSFESVLMRWMKLEPIIQSKVGQKGKHQYNILTHIYMECWRRKWQPTPVLLPGKFHRWRSWLMMTLYVR